MEFYLDRHHPADLIAAIALVQGMDEGQHSVSLFDYSSKLEDLRGRILVLVDAAKDLEVTTKLYNERGGRVFALKFPNNQVWDFYPLSLAVLDLWPKLLERLKDEREPFISKYFCEKKRLMPLIK